MRRHGQGQSAAVHPGQGGMKATVSIRTLMHSNAVVYWGTGENFARGNMYHEEIARLTAWIVEAERPEKIILFGSYASGTATESRDRKSTRLNSSH